MGFQDKMVHRPQDRALSCPGVPYDAAIPAGSIDLRCNDGAVASLNVAFLGETTAYGYGYTGTGLASLVFGMGADEARAHLTVPPNRQLHLRVDPAGLELQ